MCNCALFVMLFHFGRNKLKHILFGNFYRPLNADAAYLNPIEDSIGLAFYTDFIEIF